MGLTVFYTCMKATVYIWGGCCSGAGRGVYLKGSKNASPPTQLPLESLLVKCPVIARGLFFSLMGCSKSFPNIWEQKREGWGETFMLDWTRILTVLKFRCASFSASLLLSISLAKDPDSLWSEKIKLETEGWLASMKKKWQPNNPTLHCPSLHACGSGTSVEIWGPHSGSVTILWP